jgi:DNA-binding NtrC family response regulator
LRFYSFLSDTGLLHPFGVSHNSMVSSVLLLDDDPAIVRTLGRFFRRRGWKVTSATNISDGVANYVSERPDVVVLDLHVPGYTGLSALQFWRMNNPEAMIVVLTGQADVTTAIEAIRMGAENFLTKPVDLDRLANAANAAVEKSKLAQRYTLLCKEAGSAGPLNRLDASPHMRSLALQVRQLAMRDVPVLLTGEVGTGKGWVARILHTISERTAGPFADISCAGASPEFLEVKLFGHVATDDPSHLHPGQNTQGLLGATAGGTVLINEVDALPPSLQAKLATTIETGQFRPIGSTHDVAVNVRIIAATQYAMEDIVRSELLVPQLRTILAANVVHLLPLRQRNREDIVEVVHRVLLDLQYESGWPALPQLSADALTAIVAYDWPGNIRELRSVLEHAVLHADGDVVRARHLPLDVRVHMAHATDDQTAPDDSVIHKWGSWTETFSGPRHTPT